MQLTLEKPVSVFIACLWLTLLQSSPPAVLLVLHSNLSSPVWLLWEPFHVLCPSSGGDQNWADSSTQIYSVVYFCCPKRNQFALFGGLVLFFWFWVLLGFFDHYWGEILMELSVITLKIHYCMGLAKSKAVILYIGIVCMFIFPRWIMLPTQWTPFAVLFCSHSASYSPSPATPCPGYLGITVLCTHSTTSSSVPFQCHWWAPEQHRKNLKCCGKPLGIFLIHCKSCPFTAFSFLNTNKLFTNVNLTYPAAAQSP